MNAHVQVPLGEICTVNPRAPRGAYPENTVVSFVPMAAVDEELGAIAHPEDRPIRAVSKGYTAFEEGDVLFAKITPCMENGKAALARDLTSGIGRGSTEFHILRPGERVLGEYIYYLVRQPKFRDEAKRNFAGTAGQQRVPKQFLENTLVPLPPLDEQRRIVGILNRAAKIERLRAQAADRLREFIPALFVRMFGDPIENPMGWELERLGDLCVSVQYGISRKATEVPVGTPMLRMGNVTYEGELDCKENSLKYVELTCEEREKYALVPGDILFNRTNSKDLVGKTGVWDGRFEAVPASYFIRARLDKSALHPTFLWAFMNSHAMKRRLFELARGAIGQANINAKELKALFVLVPPLAAQGKYASIVEDVQSLRTADDLSCESAKSLSASLMNRLLDNAA